MPINSEFIKNVIIPAITGYLFFANIVAFALYGIDKRKAEKKLWRIPESVLLSVGFFGGAAGALCAMNVFRHKTKHNYFKILNTFFLILHIIILSTCVFFAARGANFN